MYGPISRTFLCRSALALCIAVLGLTGSIASYAAATVTGGKLVSVTKVERHAYDYAFALSVSNAAPALNSLAITAATKSDDLALTKSTIQLGTLAANTTITTSDVIVVRVEDEDDSREEQEEAGAREKRERMQGERYNKRSREIFEELRFTVIPGPGPVAQAQINGATGGTIAVIDQGDPLLGTTITFPPGALADTETITVGYSNTPPIALPTDAIAAGQVFVTKTVTLTRSGTAPFSEAITVTIPYDVSALGSEDFPAVVYFEPTLGMYQPVQTVGVDQANGVVTFKTKHFSYYTGTGIPGLAQMLVGSIPFSGAASHVVATSPAVGSFTIPSDTFEAQNLSTQFAGTSSGICFGLTSYAAWYFMAQPAGGTRLSQEYSSPSDPGLGPLPEQDAVAREIIARTYIDTFNDQGTFVAETQLETASDLINLLFDTHSPQLLALFNPLGGHSVMIYGWDASTGRFSAYDPNFPGATPSLTWLYSGPGFSAFVPFQSGSQTYGDIHLDAYASHYVVSDLQRIFTNVQSGLPPDGSAWLFNTLLINSPTASAATPYPGDSNGPVLKVDSTQGSTLSFTWDCSQCQAPTVSYLHLYQNNVALGLMPIVNAAAGGQAVTFTTQPFNGSNELFAFVSTDGTSVSQQDISYGYAGYQRVELQPSTQVASVTVTSATCSLSGGGAIVSASGTASGPPSATLSGFSPSPSSLSCGSWSEMSLNNGSYLFCSNGTGQWSSTSWQFQAVLSTANAVAAVFVGLEGPGLNPQNAPIESNVLLPTCQ